MSNPLQSYFRQPAVYVQLPSNGKYYPEGSINMPETRELPVFPMTAVDEITYRTSDALFNGTATVNVIKSCVPNIIDPWQMPSMDLDAVLIAIRIASYGHEMDFESRCPKCEEENSFSVDLRGILEQIKTPDYSQTVSLGNIVVAFKPLTYAEQNQNSIEQFQDTKMIATIPDAEISEEEKLKLINQAYLNLGQMAMRTIANAIDSIQADDSWVSDPEHILEFVQNCDRAKYSVIRDHLVNLRRSTEVQPLNITCTECSEEYETPFTLDVSNFFA